MNRAGESSSGKDWNDVVDDEVDAAGIPLLLDGHLREGSAEHIEYFEMDCRTSR